MKISRKHLFYSIVLVAVVAGLMKLGYMYTWTGFFPTRDE